MNKVVTLSIKPKSTLFYIVTSLVTIILLTILAISIKLSFLRAASDEGANDTGAATLNSVNIAKLGSTNSDGTSLTVTYIDGSTLSANKDNNEILNNDEVIYEASYNVTAPGIITLSLTMPANNVINEASVSEASGCMSGSKVEKANITKSYTNNKATCIINPTTTGTTTWTISTNPWGGNNQEVQPTLSISGQEQSIKPEAVKTVGKGDYGLKVTSNSYTTKYAIKDCNLRTSPDFGLYIPAKSTGIIGVSPISEFSFSIDMSGFPDGWYVYSCNNIPNSYSLGPYDGLINQPSTNPDVELRCEAGSNEESIDIKMSNIVTAVQGYKDNALGYYYTASGMQVAVPTKNLSTKNQLYKAYPQSGSAFTDGIDYEIQQYSSEIQYWLNNLDSGNSSIYVRAALVG